MLHKIRALFKKKTAWVWRCLSSPPREPQAGTRGGHREEGSVQGRGHHLLMQAEAASFSVSLFSSFFFFLLLMLPVLLHPLGPPMKVWICLAFVVNPEPVKPC